jgi:lipopolysaccharide/colanic/teichoic acid biosynthesis glycosyltransferase
LGYVLRFELEVLALETVPRPPAEEYFKAFAILAAAIVVLQRLYGLYRSDNVRALLEEVYAIGQAVSLATGLFLALSFFYRSFSYSRVAFSFFWLIAIVLLTASHAAFRRWQVRRFSRGLDRKRAIFLGEPTSYVAERILTEPAFGLEVRGLVTADAPNADSKALQAADTGEIQPIGEQSGPVGALLSSARAPSGDSAPLPALRELGSIEDLRRILDDEQIEVMLVLEHGLSHRRLLAAIDACERRGVTVRLVPPIYDLLVGPSDFTYIRDVPFIRVDERSYHQTRFALKRAVDVLVSGLGLVALSPLLLAIAGAIKLGSKGPVFFVQERAGVGGRPFPVYKFRTMVEDAEARLKEVVDVDKLDEPVFKLERDPRITGVGHFLRRTSLDEIPQLLNVLKGDMSLVGPRPEEVSMVARYDVWQRRRLKVKPGITGLQQVVARGGPSLNERVRLDVYYIRKQSLLFDAVILLRTVWVVLRGTGAR